VLRNEVCHAVTPLAPLQQDWRSAAFLRRAAASGLSRWPDRWRPPAALSTARLPLLPPAHEAVQDLDAHRLG
jgi:hypothetical protein